MSLTKVFNTVVTETSWKFGPKKRRVPLWCRQWKVGTGLTLIEIEKLDVGVQVQRVIERDHLTDWHPWRLSHPGEATCR